MHQILIDIFKAMPVGQPVLASELLSKKAVRKHCWTTRQVSQRLTQLRRLGVVTSEPTGKGRVLLWRAVDISS